MFITLVHNHDKCMRMCQDYLENRGLDWHNFGCVRIIGKIVVLTVTILFWLWVYGCREQGFKIFEASKKVHRWGYNTNMKKIGNTNRFEPTDTSWEKDFPECAALFKRAWWFSLFERIIDFNLEVSYRFAQGFIKDTVTFDTLKFELTEELIAKATGVSRDGELWFKNIPFSFNPNDFLLPEIEALDWGKGIHLSKFKPERKEAIGIL